MTIHVTDHARKRLKTRLSGHMQRPGRFIDLAYRKGLTVLSEGPGGVVHNAERSNARCSGTEFSLVHKLYQGVIFIFSGLRLVTVYLLDPERVRSYAVLNQTMNLKGVL